MIKIQVKTNVDFDKVSKNLNTILLNSIYRPIGTEARNQVQESIKTGIDMEGKPFEPLSDFYVLNNTYAPRSKGDTPLLATGRLLKSIKMQTLENGVRVFSNVLYGGKHLKKDHKETFTTKHGIKRTAQLPQRLWFYRDNQHAVNKLMKPLSRQKIVFENNFMVQLKVPMRNLGKALTV